MSQIKIFCLAVVQVVSIVSDLPAQEWPQYRGPNATGNLPRAQLDLGNKQLQIHWKTETPLGFSSFAVQDQIAVTIIGRDGNEVCVAYEVDGGKEIWARKLGEIDYKGGGNAGAQGNKGGDGPRSTPAISDGRVFVYDAHLNLYCFRATDGKEIWKHDVKNDFQGKSIKWKNATSPLIDQKQVYVAGGGDGSSFLAFEQASGKLRWKTGSETMTHASPAFAAMGGKQQVVFFTQFGLVALEAETGKSTWRSPFPFDVSTAASPIVNGDQVYCSAGYGVGAGMYKVHSYNNVEEIWRMPNRLMNHWSTPVLHQDHLFGLYRFKRYGSAPLRCVEFATGNVKWSKQGFGQGNCIVVGDKLAVLTDFGELVIAETNVNEYVELFRSKVLSGKCWSTPAYCDGKFFLRSTKEAVCVSFK